jgi:hypothetical protein
MKLLAILTNKDSKDSPRREVFNVLFDKED